MAGSSMTMGGSTMGGRPVETIKSGVCIRSAGRSAMGSESATGCQRWRSMNRGIAHRGQAASMMHQPRKGGRIGRASGSARGETRSPCRSQTARRALRRRPAEGSAASARSAAPWFATKAPAKTVCVSVCSPRQISLIGKSRVDSRAVFTFHRAARKSIRQDGQHVLQARAGH